MTAKTKALLLAALLLVLIPLCQGCGENGSTESTLPSYEPGPEEYQVYAALLNRFDFSGNQSSLLIQETTVPLNIHEDHFHTGFSKRTWKFSYPMYHFEEKTSIPEIGLDTLADYSKKNIRPCLLKYRFPLEAEYFIFDPAEIGWMGKAGPEYWRRLSRRYPGYMLYTVFSRVGFDRDKTRAFVYHSFEKGHLTGYGHFYFLRKIKGKWVVKDWSRIWMS